MSVRGAITVKPYEKPRVNRTVGHLKRSDLSTYATAMQTFYADHGLLDLRLCTNAYSEKFSSSTTADHMDLLSFTADGTTSSLQVGDVVQVMRDTDTGLKMVHATIAIVDHNIDIAEVGFLEDGLCSQFQLTELTPAPAGSYDGIFQLVDDFKRFSTNTWGLLLDDCYLSQNRVASIPFALVSTIGLPAAQIAHFKSAKVMFSKPVSGPIMPYTILTLCNISDGTVDSHAIVLYECLHIKGDTPVGSSNYRCIKFLKRGKRNQKPWLDFVRPNCLIFKQGHN